MNSTNRPERKNHAHWDHGASRPAPRPPRWETAAVRRFLERHHLPAHPAGPLALIVLGLAHCLMIAGLFRNAGTGDPALSFAVAAICGFVLVPGVGLMATGIWDLARQPWHRFTRR